MSAEDNLDAELEQFALQLKKTRKVKKKAPAAAAAPAAAPSADSAAPETASETGTSEAAVPSTGSAAPVDPNREYTYTEMLERVFEKLRERNPNYMERSRHKLPPPQLVRVGSRKVMWANFRPTCDVLHRSLTHVQSFILAELGAEGSVDGSERLVLKGRFFPRQMESLIKKYIHEYVTCRMCKSPNTALERDSVTRLYFLQCQDCKSRRSVTPIKSGFHATSRADRRAAKQAKQ